MDSEYIGNLVLSDRIMYTGKISCENGIITGIQQLSGKNDTDLPYIFPGLIDIHNHGAMGHDYMEASDEAFDEIGAFLTRHGITTAQCTTVSADRDELLKFLKFYRKRTLEEEKGCRFCGVHLEGPYLAVKSRGAHPERALLTPEDGYDWILENSDVVREITVAPELPGMPEMIRSLSQAEIVVSGGHDDGEIKDIEKAVISGMRHCTHIFCAMSTLHKKGGQRQAGLCEYAMTHDNITAEMIADNHHIPALLATMIYRCKGPGKICLVSDAIAPAGLPESEQLYSLGTGAACTKVYVEDGVAVVEDRSCYAGSVQSIDQMIANLVRYSNIPLVDAVRMATLTPAEIIGINRECGSITCGKKADLCIVDKEFQVIQTIVGGRTVFKR